MNIFAIAYQCPSSGVPVNRIFRRVLQTKGLSQKHAALTMGGVAYEATLSRALAGLGPLDLHALLMLDARVLWKLFRVLLHAKLAIEERELFDDRRQA